ncbi:hypothetical protein BU14_0746s0009 [Porphyra umbilicalis]|uniref:Uncharacterized protein n=1 Tax=Porphyra umbilicalis TaxID=2786 RepID=A0A1X6NP79_PORUM|nr:hypothetical protein BU14_0746s0009 [Porphyra umbilicalis]|eukprot:OSX70469.1 hypothetical protein BU14_0746s0009 [Porphyra umbilicalis]
MGPPSDTGNGGGAGQLEAAAPARGRRSPGGGGGVDGGGGRPPPRGGGTDGGHGGGGSPPSLALAVAAARAAAAAGLRTAVTRPWRSVRQLPADAPPDAAAAPPNDGVATALVNTATLAPVPPSVPLRTSLQFVTLLVDGVNFTDATSARLITCAAQSGVGASAWRLVNATRFTTTLLQATYAVVVPDAHTSAFARRWVASVRSGTLGTCAGLPDGSTDTSVAPFDARADVALPARSVAVWIPAMIIAFAGLVALLAVAVYALVHLNKHVAKEDLADPDAPEFAAVEEARDVEGAGSDGDEESGYDSDEGLPLATAGSAAAPSAAAGASADAPMAGAF